MRLVCVCDPSGGVQLVFDVAKVDAARRGDKESFAQVYESVAPDLYKFALYTLGNTHDAEDVVSETFMEAYRGISKLREPASFRPWILRILSARCKRKIAEYIKGKNEFDLETFSIVLADEGDLSADISEQITVMQALGRLSDTERMLLMLSVLEGYTAREISQITGSPQGTVSSKLHRSLTKLRKMLA